MAATASEAIMIELEKEGWVADSEDDDDGVIMKKMMVNGDDGYMMVEIMLSWWRK